MALDAVRQSRGVAIFWQPRRVELSEWRANKFSLMEDFCILDSRVKGSLRNVYGPNSFFEKQYFMDLLSWLKEQTNRGT